jgi:hypothetical protein
MTNEIKESQANEWSNIQAMMVGIWLVSNQLNTNIEMCGFWIWDPLNT